MPQYNSNHPDSIRDVFDRDGESLARAGFTIPSDVKVVADDTRPRSEPHMGMSQIAIDAMKAWELTGSDELFQKGKRSKYG